MVNSLSRTRRLLTASVLLCCPLATIYGQTRSRNASAAVPKPILLRILQAEDERRWDKDLEALVNDPQPIIRKRAILAAGRIGDENAVSVIASRLDKETTADLQSIAAFALGEIESAAAIDVLIAHVGNRNDAQVRGRAVEALGKIAAVIPKTEEARGNEAKQAILKALEFEAGRRSASDKEVILLGLTAALRARSEGAGKVIAQFLTYRDPQIRGDAANALARLRAKDGNEQLRKLLVSDPDPIVRANAARVLGATEDKESITLLLDRLEKDEDERVRVSAVRAFVALKPDNEALVNRFLEHAHCQRSIEKQGKVLVHVREDYECLDNVSALGRLFQGKGNTKAIEKIRWWLSDFLMTPPEAEVALVRIDPAEYLKSIGTNPKEEGQRKLLTDWRAASALAQGLGEFALLPETTKDKVELSKRVEEILRAMLDYRNSGLTINTLVAVNSEYAIPDVLRAYAAFKPADLATILREHLQESDPVVRGTAAELLAELPPNDENSKALIAALPVSLNDQQLNDAALAIVDALAKQKSAAANEALKLALRSNDYLVRRRAAVALKANDAGDFAAQVGPVRSKNSLADYERALGRANKKVLATIKTKRGNIIIELLPSEAPLTVDNFVQLARRGYFNRVTFHRVVANFVIQGGDPRGDGNGGPGYSIRCEINMVPYDRGAVGMALSGKDTGGSQWFITHSPQPHLEGGYTVFGRVIEGMEVVDATQRGDTILSVNISERKR